jgi:hypothetical protein
MRITQLWLKQQPELGNQYFFESSIDDGSRVFAYQTTIIQIVQKYTKFSDRNILDVI